MSQPAFRLAIASNLISPDVRQNGAQIRDIMERAAGEGARLIQFPEAALSGYVKSEIDNWACVDWSALRDELALVCSAARLLGVHVVIGCNHQSGDGVRPRNSLHVISDAGEIVARYDKRYCSNSEITDWYQAGNAPCVFDVDGFRFGCALCIEIQFSEVFVEYERRDVDCVLLSSYSRDPMYWIQSQGHAAGNNMWIGVSTPHQCGDRLPGGLIGPDGEPLARLDPAASADFVVGVVDRDAPQFEVALNKARPWRRLARAGRIYGR